MKLSIPSYASGKDSVTTSIPEELPSVDILLDDPDATVEIPSVVLEALREECRKSDRPFPLSQKPSYIPVSRFHGKL